jgi:N-methylhydantoinase A
MSFRVSVDIGGTCTDVVVASDSGGLTLGKAMTTRQHPQDGLAESLADAARQLGLTGEEILASTDLFLYSTTRATNAILEGATATTALLVTEGFGDVLVRREGGRLAPYDFTRPPAEPYIPRRLTFGITERITAEGDVLIPLDEAAVRATLAGLPAQGVEAVAVCLLWSTANPAHEDRVAALIGELLPGLPVTLSHRINPIIREYRRASAAAIDASLKPLMQQHLHDVEAWLRAGGYQGPVVAATSSGGVMFLGDLIERPIHAARSGPSLAPVAGQAYAAAETGAQDVIVCDTGGTSFDVSLIRAGRPVFTRETWLGEPYTGHLTGLASRDVRSVGAGGGSIAFVDDGGLLHVGPASAGSEPGPACYGRGGTAPTVTDAAVVLGYLDPGAFLGGRIRLDQAAARAVLEPLAARLGMSVTDAAQAVLVVAGEHMADAIREITINEGVDPRDGLVVAGGGAAGMTIAAIVESIGCRQVLLPRTAGALSAAGGQWTDVLAEFTVSQFTDTETFDHAGVRAALDALAGQAAGFTALLADQGIKRFELDHIVESRYRQQVWDIEVPFGGRPDLSEAGGPEGLRQRFHAEHRRIFAVDDPDAHVEFVAWKVRVRGVLDKPALTPATVPGRAGAGPAAPAGQGVTRGQAHFPGAGLVDTPFCPGAALEPGATAAGPLVVREPTTTIVVPPGWTLTVTSLGNYLMQREGEQ